jgi:hypothetical protein
MALHQFTPGAPVEIFESEYPLRVRAFEAVRDDVRNGYVSARAAADIDRQPQETHYGKRPAAPRARPHRRHGGTRAEEVVRRERTKKNDLVRARQRASGAPP